MIYVSETGDKGRGVFANQYIIKNTMIEKAPIILLPETELEFIQKTKLKEYWFNWFGDIAIGLGSVSLYNHSDNPNAEFLLYKPKQLIIINAIQNISQDTEICINYKNNNLTKDFT